MNISNEIISAMCGAVAGGIVSCVFNYFNDRRKERRMDEKEEEKERQRRFENRPEFKIIECQENCCPEIEESLSEKLCIVTAEFKASVEKDFVYANFAEDEIDEKEWTSVRYRLENVGKTDVSSVSLICQDKRHFWLCEKYYAQDFMKSRILHYVAHFDNKIRVGESFEIILFYNKKHNYLPMIDIGMQDPGNHFWVQPLFAPQNRVGDSREIEYSEYLDAIKPNVAEDCFKHPWLW